MILRPFSIPLRSIAVNEKIAPAFISAALHGAVMLGGFGMDQGASSKVPHVSIPQPVALVFQQIEPCPPVPSPKKTATPTLRKVMADATEKAKRHPQASEAPSVNPPISVTKITPSHNNMKPTYPEQARRQRIEGRVILQLKINAAGKVISIAFVGKRAHPLLEQATQEAVKQWSFILVNAPSEIITQEISLDFYLVDNPGL